MPMQVLAGYSLSVNACYVGFDRPALQYELKMLLTRFVYVTALETTLLWQRQHEQKQQQQQRKWQEHRNLKQ